MGKIEKACSGTGRHSVIETAVMTSAKKLFVSPWANAPGTPVSEAWETHSGPVLSGPCEPSPKVTPIRKVILKLSPQPVHEKPTKKIKIKPSALREFIPSDSKIASVLPLDVEQQLAKISNDFDSNEDSNLIARSIESLEPEFAKESIAVREWLKTVGFNILRTSHSSDLKLATSRGTSMFLCATSDYSGLSAVIEALLEYCTSNIPAFSRCPKLIRNLCSTLGNLPLDDALVMKFSSALIDALNSTMPSVDKANIARVLVSITSPDAQELLRQELVSAKSSESQDYSYDGLAFCLQLQSELMKEGLVVDESLVKNALGPFSEDLLKRFSAFPAQAASVLSRLLKGLSLALQKPTCIIAASVAKHLASLTILTLTSEKLKLDVASKNNLVDGLSSLCSFIRKIDSSKAKLVQLPLTDEFSSAYLKTAQASFSSLYGVEVSNGPCTENLHQSIFACYLESTVNNCLVILVRLASESPLQLKIKALRSLLSILRPLDSFAAKTGFVPFVLSKLVDTSVSVRDISLEILGKCLSIPDQLTLLKDVLPLLRDGSSNVQKRAIRMLREMLSLSLELESEAPIVANLMTVVKVEDDQISSLALKALKEQWLCRILQRSNDRQELIQFVALIVRIIREIPVHSDSIQVFLSKCSSDKDVSSAALRSLCCGTVDVLFETLIGSIEKSDRDSVQFILKAITVFVGQEHEYLASHLRLLFELSKSDDMVTVDYALRLMKLAVSGVDRAVVLQLHECEQHLVSLILKGSESVVKGAVDFFAGYCQHVKGQLDVFDSLCNRFSLFLESKKNRILSDELVSPVCRALFTLGRLQKCRLELALNDGLSLALFVHYSQSPNKMVSFYAAQSVAFAVSASPRLALQSEITQVIKTALHCLGSVGPFLEAFELLLQRPVETSKVCFDHSMQSSEANISATIIQIFILDIVEVVYSCTQKDTLVLCLRILSTSLSSGLCHPHQVIPALVSLTAAFDSEISSKAKDTFGTMLESHSSFLFSNYTSIIRGMYRVRSLAAGSPSGFTDVDHGPESLVTPLYEALRTKKSKRNDLTDVLLQEFQEACDKDYIRFVLENIAWLPFKNLEEVSALFGQVSEIALSRSSEILESDSSAPKQIDLVKAVGILCLRGFLATGFALNNDRCEKALNQDSFGKSSVFFDASANIQLHIPDVCEIETIKSLLDEQKFIEMTFSGQKAKVKPVPKKRKKGAKRRRPSYECSSEPESDISDSGDDCE